MHKRIFIWEKHGEAREMIRALQDESVLLFCLIL